MLSTADRLVSRTCLIHGVQVASWLLDHLLQPFAWAWRCCVRRHYVGPPARLRGLAGPVAASAASRAGELAFPLFTMTAYGEPSPAAIMSSRFLPLRQCGVWCGIFSQLDSWFEVRKLLHWCAKIQRFLICRSDALPAVGNPGSDGGRAHPETPQGGL